MLNLEETKLHLRVDGDEENSLIQSLMLTATAAVLDHLNVGEVNPYEGVFPHPVRAAGLLLVGDLYANREAQTDRPLTDNKAFARLLAPYRQY